MKNAVIAHIFYKDLWPEIRNAIRNFPVQSTDVFLTCPETDSDLMGILRADMPNAKIIPVGNRGFDVLPFLTVVKTLRLDEYLTVTKLHTKRDVSSFYMNFWPYFGSAWRRSLLRFCSSERRVRRAISRFEKDERLGMVGAPEALIPIVQSDGNEEYLHRVQKEIADSNDGICPPMVTGSSLYIAGTIFMMRASLLKRIQERISLEGFAIPDAIRHDIVTRAHILELFFGAWVTANGYKINGPSLWRGVVVARRWLLKPLSMIRQWIIGKVSSNGD